jgi:hypothetical protein
MNEGALQCGAVTVIQRTKSGIRDLRTCIRWALGLVYWVNEALVPAA